MISTAVWRRFTIRTIGRRIGRLQSLASTAGKADKATVSEVPSPVDSQSALQNAPTADNSLAKSTIIPSNPFRPTPQTWVTTLTAAEEQRVGIIDLNPEIFRTKVRLDILHENIAWQDRYRCVSFTKALNRAEMPGSGKKPWPQKGTGRARHGSKRSPIWYAGGIHQGLRGPVTLFYMLPDSKRVYGLCNALTIKHTQDDLVIVDDFDTLPNDEPEFLEELAQKRNWGYSVLFVHDTDTAPRNLALAASEIVGFEIMPVYGLNCYSMLHFDTLVLSKAALAKIEERLTTHLHRTQPLGEKFRYIDHKRKLLSESEYEEDEYHTPFV